MIKGKKIKERTAVSGTYSNSRLTATGRHLPLWDHTVLLDTRYKWTRPALPQLGTRFTYPGGMEGWVDLGYPALHRQGVERVRDLSITSPMPYNYTTEPLSVEAVESDLEAVLVDVVVNARGRFLGLAEEHEIFKQKHSPRTFPASLIDNKLVLSE